MQIRRFHTPDLTASSETLLLPPAEANHALRVLRLGKGDRLQLMNGRGIIADAEIMDLGDSRRPKEAPCRILSLREITPPAHPLTLCVAPPRGKAFDLVLKAAVELGISAIQPILCEYGVARPEDASDSWQETLVAAMKQSSNPFLPLLLPPMEFSKALESSSGVAGLFGASPAAEATAFQRLTPQTANSIARVWVGPEGGFAPQEEEALLKAGAIPVTLGRCVLRVETAVPALLGCIYGVANLCNDGAEHA